MPEEGDNFRKQFLYKVAAIRPDDKKIDIMLGEKPVDIKKLSTYIKSHGLPSLKRLAVWKIMLGEYFIIDHLTLIFFRACYILYG